VASEVHRQAGGAHARSGPRDGLGSARCASGEVHRDSAGAEPAAPIEPQPAPRLRAELGIEQDRPGVGIVGRMVPVKNHELLFDVMALLKGRMDPAPHLIVVGSGERSWLYGPT